MNFNSLTDCYELYNGVKIPCIGFGTWQSSDGQEAYNAVYSALECGYRHIDTAKAYGNEESVGKAINDFISKNNVSREEVFITTKLWNDDHGYKSTKKAIDESLKKLGTDYLDLYLVHWPNPLKFRNCWQETNQESWLAMEEAYSEGKIRAIGVSNFYPRHLESLLQTAKITPMVNQIKICPGLAQDDLCQYSKNLKMIVEGYSPLGTGGIFSSQKMQELAEKYNKTIAQICIRWSLQKGNLPLPKSVTPQRIKENSQIFDFSLTEDDLNLISNLENLNIKPARNPDEAEF